MNDIQIEKSRDKKGTESASITSLVTIVILRLLLLPLRRVAHRVCLARLTQQRLALLFTVLHLLVLLHEIAWPAAASAEAILAPVSSQVVLRANVASINERQDPGKAHAGQSGECSALPQSVDSLAKADLNVRSCCSRSILSCRHWLSCGGGCVRT